MKPEGKHLAVSRKGLGPHSTHQPTPTPLTLCTPFLCQVTSTLYPWMSPFWLSSGGGSQVTSSCVAVALWITTFCGAAVGTGRHGGWASECSRALAMEEEVAREEWGP